MTPRSTQQPERAVRVAHVGTGYTGRVALAGVITDPALELVAVQVSGADKAGKDAGDLCGLPATGITATTDADEVIALRPDCVTYCATAVRREDDAIDDMARYLRAGIDVVTISTIPMVYPAAAPTRWQETIGAAALAGGSTFYATGSEPGVISLNLPTALLAGAGRVDAYRMDEYALNLDRSYPIWDVLHESMGIGKPEGHVPARIASGKVEQDWGTVIRNIADVLGVAVDSVELDWDSVTAPEDLPTDLGVVPAGTSCGHRWRLAGVVDGEPVIAVQYFATVSSTPWPEHWPAPSSFDHGGVIHRVTGDPGMRLELYLSPAAGPEPANPAIRMTAMALVNAVPAVVQADPGVITRPLAGPSIATRQHSMTQQAPEA